MLDYLTVNEAAETLGISRWTVLRLIASGELAADKLGPGTSPWLVRRDSVEARKAAA